MRIMDLGNKLVLGTLVAFLLMSGQAAAQPLYTMQNLTVDDCEGTITDSDEGPEEGQYDHNEDYTFTICVEGAEEIVLTFDFFATEEALDVLTIYDGPDIGAPVISELSGILNPPPVIVANSGCITLHFSSDESIVASGWSASWEIEVAEPDLPEIIGVESPDCPASSAVFELDAPIDCDLLDAQYFSGIGPGNVEIASVVPLDCDPDSQLASRFEVVFAEALDIPGDFRLFFEGEIVDACGDSHPFQTNILFQLSNCPIAVEIQEDFSACIGECGRVEANVTGNPEGDFVYDWSHTSLDQPSVEVCFDDTMEIIVAVEDLTSGSIATDTFVYIPLENPVILNPFRGDTLCSSRGNHNYSSSLPGGVYDSRIIPNHHRESGRYEFWRWNWNSDLERDIVRYEAPNGCVTTDTLFVYPVSAGSIQASCLGAMPFSLNGGNPGGGVWDGEHLSPDGIFDPVESGSFVVSYTAPNGCVSWKRVNVSDSVIMPDIDTLCSNQDLRLEAEPYGGRWSGPGVLNAVNGRTQTWRMPPDSTYTYTYALEGCTYTMDIHIKAISAGPDRTICTGEEWLSVSGQGEWSGPAPFHEDSMAFDVSGLPEGNYNFTYTSLGCSDQFELFVRDVRMEEIDTMYFCLEAGDVLIGDYIEFVPGGGQLSGPGVIWDGSQYIFRTDSSGAGIHQLVYEHLGCRDTVEVEVESPADIPDYSFCERSGAEVLVANPPGGVWSGPGFLDASVGLFDPQSLSPGSYSVTYTALSGCETEVEIEIFLFEEVEIRAVENQYCYSDTLIEVVVDPPGGRFFINGDSSGLEFNPMELGPGNHELLYTRGSGACASTSRKFIGVFDPISGAISAGRDSLCPQENTEIRIAPNGGRGIVSAQWSDGLGFGVSHIVRPSETKTYFVELTDGCSAPYRDSIELFVHEDFEVPIEYGPPVCYGDSTYAEVLLSPGNYDLSWKVDPPRSNFRLEALPGPYGAEIKELSSGCMKEIDVTLPGSPPLKANLSIIPNQDCISNIENEIEIVDLSTNYSTGFIDFGDGAAAIQISPGESIRHAYIDTGQFVIEMTIENELGCRDSISRSICVKNEVRVFVPNIFTPNGDGRNDEFFVDAYGVGEVQWRIFDRFGELVFEGNSEEARWDGSQAGIAVTPGVYVVQLRYTDRGTGEKHTYHGTVTVMK